MNVELLFDCQESKVIQVVKDFKGPQETRVLMACLDQLVHQGHSVHLDSQEEQDLPVQRGHQVCIVYDYSMVFTTYWV